jgi:hypothetical protein
MPSSKKKRVRRKLTVLRRIGAARIIQRAFRNTSQCAICLQLVQKKCGCCHSFHDSCRERWIGMGKTCCPMCRVELPLSLEHKKQYFIDSSNLLKELKHCIEIWDPNYFADEEFKSWNRKLTLGNYFVEIIDKQLANYPLPLSSLYTKNFDKMDMLIEGTNRLIAELTESLEDLRELNGLF